MPKQNELLNKEIETRIRQARNKKTAKEPRPPFFYMIIVFLLTVTVLVTIWRYLRMIF